MSESTLAVAMSNIGFRWPGSQQAISIQSLELPVGSRVFLYGPSGSGKSTLLNLLAGIAQPLHGELRVLGQNLPRMWPWRRDRFRANHIGVIFQQFNLIPYLTVEDNVLLARHFAHVKAPKDHERAVTLLARLGLAGDLLTRRADALSVGQQQRVAVARALINEPELILADEPTSALDSDSRDNFMQLLVSEADRYQSTLVFVSHDRALRNHFPVQWQVQDIVRLGV